MINYLRDVCLTVQGMESKIHFSEEDELTMLLNQGSEKRPSYADQVVQNIEAEFKGIRTATKEREEEKLSLQQKHAALKSKLGKMKNIRNPNKVALNTEISKKRALIRKEMEDIKERLAVIETEEQGSSITSQKLTSAGK